jgi:hypothetical protein
MGKIAESDETTSEKVKSPKRHGLGAFLELGKRKISIRIQHPRVSQSAKASATALLPET